MLYTRKGDDGRSGLFGTTERFPKNSLVYEALGALDELNSLLGVCKAQAKRSALRGALDIAPIIARVQEIIFIAQAEIAGAPKKVTQTHVDELEAAIGTIERQIENPTVDVLDRLTLTLGVKLQDLFIEPVPGAEPPKPLRGGRRPRD